MSRSGELFMAAHEELIEEMLEANPGMTDEEAERLTEDSVWDRMEGRMADKADMEYEKQREML